MGLSLVHDKILGEFLFVAIRIVYTKLYFFGVEKEYTLQPNTSKICT